MKNLQFTTTFKAEGKEYERIVFWNRFVRNKTELILSFLPGIISITLMIMGYRTMFAMIIYFVCIIYPYISYRQFKSAVAYHLKHRDAIESAPCSITVMDKGILVEFINSEEKRNYWYDDCTTIYDRVGYYLFFNKSQMLVMIRKADIPSQYQEEFIKYIDQHIDHNKCIIK